MTLEVAGSWWTPTTPDHKVPGILTFDPQKAGRLTLIGGFRTPEGSSYGRLHGECEGRSFTLEGCFQQSVRGAPSAPYGEVVYVNNVFENIWFSVGERAEADVLHFDLDGLTEWVAQSGLVQTVSQSSVAGKPWARLEGILRQARGRVARR
jgi:hypothetical protein